MGLALVGRFLVAVVGTTSSPAPALAWAIRARESPAPRTPILRRLVAGTSAGRRASLSSPMDRNSEQNRRRRLLRQHHLGEGGAGPLHRQAELESAIAALRTRFAGSPWLDNCRRSRGGRSRWRPGIPGRQETRPLGSLNFGSSHGALHGVRSAFAKYLWRAGQYLRRPAASQCPRPIALAGGRPEIWSPLNSICRAWPGVSSQAGDALRAAAAGGAKGRPLISGRPTRALSPSATMSDSGRQAPARSGPPCTRR